MSEQEEKIYSLYVHTFPNGKVYVGITGRKPEDRWDYGVAYCKKRKDGIPTQPKMYRAIKKYGWCNVKHEIILQTKFKDEIEKQERYFITEVYHSDQDEFGYNIEKGGRFSGKMSEENRLDLINRLTGKNNPQYGKHYWNNGKIQIVSKECPGENFILGSLPRSKEFCNKMKVIANDPDVQNKKSNGMAKCNISERRWWTNGEKQKFCKECPGEGWYRGTLPVNKDFCKKISLAQKGKFMWNNGIKQTYSRECPGKGWVKGCLPLSEEKRKNKREKQKKSLLKKYGVDNMNLLPNMIKYNNKKNRENHCNYGKKWFNNGIKNVLAKECPEGYTPGMLPMPKEIVEAHKLKVKGNRYWTNGKENKMCKECPGEGWYLGKTDYKIKEN